MTENLREALTVPEVVGVEIPAEPARGSVVLDRHGRAWQRVDRYADNPTWSRHRWATPGASIVLFGTAAQPWEHLVVDCGPVTLVHRAEVTS
jgi:hypothetical protein